MRKKICIEIIDHSDEGNFTCPFECKVHYSASIALAQKTGTLAENDNPMFSTYEKALAYGLKFLEERKELMNK